MRRFCKDFSRRLTPVHSRKSGNFRFGWLTRCCLIVIGLVGPQALRADIVVLSNGDRLSGEVEQLRNQKLSFKTSYAGTIQINWADVTELTTEHNFEVIGGALCEARKISRSFMKIRAPRSPPPPSSL
jgi:hypothetical protein